jgi:hypothetical protein
MRTITPILLSISLSLVACGEEEKETLEPAAEPSIEDTDDTDTDDTDTDDTDTDDTGTDDTGTDDTGEDSGDDTDLDSDDDGDGASENDGDCDDSDAGLNIDDSDGDGFSTCEGDCDDGDLAINPDASDDTDDGIDNDCDGQIDEDLISNNIGIDQLGPGILIITEIMNNPSVVNDSEGEWFEIHNTGSQSIDLNGMVVSDQGSNTFMVSTSLIISPNGFTVFGVNDDSSVNGGATVDYVYDSMVMALGNGDDELIISNVSGTLDEVLWDNGSTFPDPNGASLNLDPSSFTDVANDDGANWCESSSVLSAGDFGTPGALNDTCPVAPVVPTWSADIQPLFQSNGCISCHSGQLSSLSMLLTVQAGDYSYSSAGANMPWVTPNDPANSYLQYKLAGTQSSVSGGGGQMPQGGSFSQTEIDLVEDWIIGGAQ